MPVFEQAQQVCVALHWLASAMDHAAFKQALTDESARFDWATPALHEKLRTTFFEQARWATRSYNVEADPVDGLVAAMRKEAKAIAGQYQLTLDVEQCQWKSVEGTSIMQSIADLLDDGMALNLTMKAAGADAGITSAVLNLADYVQARITLTTHTGHERFERALASLTSEYVLSGYPEDLLVYDARKALQDAPLHQLALEKTRCQSFWFEEPDSIECAYAELDECHIF